MITMLGVAAAFIAFLHMTLATGEAAACISVTLPDFLTTGTTGCYDHQPVDICTPFNENNAEEVQEIINCTSYDATYKLYGLTVLLNDFVASTLPEEERNESLSQANFIVNWCANGWALPTYPYFLTCDEYLEHVTVTCDKPVTLSVPEVNNVSQCIQNVPLTDVCKEGNAITWGTFTNLIGVIRCIYFSVMAALPSPEST